MRKIWKATVAVAMSAFMAASLAACGSGSSSGGSAAPAQSETPSTGETGAAADAAAPAGDAAAPIKIGGSGPLTGPAAVYGNAVKIAAEMAVEEVNAKGGVQFALQFEDDKHDAEEAATAYGTLKDGGMQISLATVTSAPGAAVSPLYQEDQTFAITPSGSSPSVIYADGENQTGAYGNVFQMCFSDPNQGSGSATYIAAHPDLGTKIAVIYKNDDPYSRASSTPSRPRPEPKVSRSSMRAPSRAKRATSTSSSPMRRQQAQTFSSCPSTTPPHPRS